MMPDLQIDPVEAALAVIGVRPILSRKTEQITLGAAREMAGLGKVMRDHAQDVARGGRRRIPLGDVDVEKMLDELTTGFNEQQLTDMCSNFPLPMQDLIPGFLALADKALGYLRTIIPKQSRMTLLGPQDLPPPHAAVRKFTATVIVLDDPMRVYSLIATGSLLKSQVQAMQEIYPTLSSALTLSLKDACEKERAADRKYEIPPLTEIGSRIWLGQPQVSPQLGTAMQQAHEDAKQKAANQRKQPASASIVAKEALSQTQKSLYREALTTE